MSTFSDYGSLFIKAIKLFLNFIIIGIYRFGNNGGKFLGVGGTWNMYEYKDCDVEIIASGVFVGYFIYTAVSILANCCGGQKKSKLDIRECLMNGLGIILWLLVSVIALHYWYGYENDYYALEQDAAGWGVFLGFLCLFSAILYIVDLIIPLFEFVKEMLAD